MQVDFLMVPDQSLLGHGHSPVPHSWCVSRQDGRVPTLCCPRMTQLAPRPPGSSLDKLKEDSGAITQVFTAKDPPELR